ncbi:MAG: hypothetical protein QF570_09970 [Myxococcota bacterium]|jgi:hypothetical protein|nr:hypothetical protein [Myxococcota bacterium]
MTVHGLTLPPAALAALMRSPETPVETRLSGKPPTCGSAFPTTPNASPPATATQHSPYTRDPDDPVQREPRTASTLFVANLVALLQAAREEGVKPEPCEVLPNHHTLFGNEDVRSLVGDILFEQAWSAPAGTGEIGIQHNAFVRHASWYRGLYEKGWPIGVRFLQ